MTVYVTGPGGTTAYEISTSGGLQERNAEEYRRTSNESPTDDTTILQFLIDCGLRTPETPCGGRGTCRKCKVTIQMGMQKLQVLACKTRLQNGMVIHLPEDSGHHVIETGSCFRYAVEKDFVGTEESYAMAVDIGTTTVVSYLLRCKAGDKPQIAAVESAPNRQRIYGADVISRIQAAAEGKLQKQTDLIRSQITSMEEILLQKSGITGPVSRIAIAGNTVMCHLFAGISPESMGSYPFLPESRFGNEENGIYIAPAMSGFIGGDITSDLIAVEAEKKNHNWLLMDIGTNGEMVLGVKGRWYACSAAAGPALEGAMITKGMPAMKGAICKVGPDLSWEVIGANRGGLAEGICGSGLIDLIAVLRKNGLVDETGLLQTETGRYYLTPEVFITQEDVRQVQLAKAALAAGIRVLCKVSGIRPEDISEVMLAGGFGSSIDKNNAAAIGLLPESLLPYTRSIGNAAGEGAISLAVSETARRKARQFADCCQYVELSGREDFMEWFVEEMNFPQA